MVCLYHILFFFSLLLFFVDLILLRLHCREGQHFPNAPVVGQEHNHTIDTHAESTSWGQTVLKRTTESLVDKLGLVITLVLLASLLLEAKALLRSNVQLRVTSEC